jgi:hypothetical protein
MKKFDLHLGCSDLLRTLRCLPDILSCIVLSMKGNSIDILPPIAKNCTTFSSMGGLKNTHSYLATYIAISFVVRRSDNYRIMDSDIWMRFLATMVSYSRLQDYGDCYMADMEHVCVFTPSNVRA